MAKIYGTVDVQGLWIAGMLFSEKLLLGAYIHALGKPDRTIDAGPPAPAGHRNNQVHLFDKIGIYLTEHHESRLVESVNFVFDELESPFQIEKPFTGGICMYGCEIVAGMTEGELSLVKRDLRGEYSFESENCWIGLSAVGKKGLDGKRTKPRFVVRVSVCFLAATGRIVPAAISD